MLSLISPFFSSPSQLKGKGGFYFCPPPPNTFFISLMCAPPSPAFCSPRGSGNVSPRTLSGQGSARGGLSMQKQSTEKSAERVGASLSTGSSSSLPETLKLIALYCVCVCVCIIALIRDFRVDLCLCLFPDLHYTSLYTPITGYDRVHTLQLSILVCVCDREKEGTCLNTLPTFPLDPCPPASYTSISVFISLSLVTNKVNEEEYQADGRTVHYTVCGAVKFQIDCPVIHAQ